MKPSARYTEIILWILAALFLSYTIVRAALVSITHDEAFSYLQYGVKSYLEIAKSPPPHIPNNHILNTLLFKASTQIFGVSHFTLRIPNLFFHALFLVYSVLWLRKFQSNFIKISGFLLLSANVYLLDFFALARGYGMGASLLFISLFYLFKYVEDKKLKSISFGMVAAALAVYANFTFLYAFLGFVGVYNVLFLADCIHIKTLLKKNIPILIITTVLACLIVIPLKKISGDLFGGADSFFNNTVKSLSHSYLYTNSGNGSVLLASFIVLLFSCALFYFLYTSLKRKKTRLTKLNVSLLVLVLVLLIQVVQHYLLGTPYITHRTAILYMPLFFTMLICWLHALEQQGEFSKKIAIILCLLLSTGALANTLIGINIKSAFEWKYDAYNEAVVTDLITLRESENIRLGNTWFYEPGLNFYRQSKPLPWLHPVNRESLYAKNDFYLVHLGMDPNFLVKMQDEVQLVKSYSEDVLLYKSVE